MLVIEPTEYKSLRPFVVATIATYLQDEDKDVTDMAEWVEATRAFRQNVSWKEVTATFCKVFNVSEPRELVEVYECYKYEINDRLIPQVVIGSLRDALSRNPIIDHKQGWTFDDWDLLILDDNNRGLVARFGLLDCLREIAWDIQRKHFEIPYSE